MEHELQFPPPNVKLPYHAHSISELTDLWNISRSSLFRRLDISRKYIGSARGKMYSSEQVILLCFLFQPPAKYFEGIIWMEINGWKTYLYNKYNIPLEEGQEPETKKE
jgi:hypothetical protein